MPRTSLDATTVLSTERETPRSIGNWCRKVLSGMKKSTCLLAASGLAGLSCQSADAQVQASPMYYQGGSPDAGAAAIYNQPFSAQQLPWPGISPYHPSNVLSTTHSNRNGLWMKDVAYKGRDYYFSVEAVWTDIKDSGSKPIGQNPLPGSVGGTGQLTGAPVPTIVPGAGVGTNGFLTPALESLFDQLPDDFVLIGGGVFPYPLLSFDEQDAVEADLDLVASNAAYPIRTLADIPQDSLFGSRIRWGFDNQDGSGFELSVYHLGDNDAKFSLGTDNLGGVPLTPTLINVNPFTLINVQLGAIPLDNGLPTFPTLGPDFGITGSTQKYDIFYEIANRSEIFGVSGSVFNTSLFSGKSARVRLFWGGDYTSVDETFSFRGIDSGGTLNLEDYQSDAGVLPGGGGGGGGGGAGDILGGRPADFEGDIVVPALTPLSADRPIFAFLDSNTRSHLAGPTVGLRYDFGGGETFNVWGETVFGVLINNERTVITSKNIAEQQHSKVVYGTALDAFSNPDGTPRADDFATATYERSETHVSPMFKQGIHAELAVGGLIPPLRKTFLFEDAKITLGYQVTIIGEMQRPGEAIYWRGFTGDPANSFPFPISDRSTLLWQEANLGVEWDF